MVEGLASLGELYSWALFGTFPLRAHVPFSQNFLLLFCSSFFPSFTLAGPVHVIPVPYSPC